jgi:aminoglycoside phosphotransferase (APT) family kinase protein
MPCRSPFTAPAFAASPCRRDCDSAVPGGDTAAWHREMRELYRSVRRFAFPPTPERPRAEIDRAFRGFLENPQNFRFAPTLPHGETHSSHALWNHGDLSGLIDWGFASVGDPAREFARRATHSGTRSLSRLTRGRASRRDRTVLRRVEFYRYRIPLWRIRNSAQIGDLAGFRHGLGGLRRALRLPPTEAWSR